MPRLKILAALLTFSLILAAASPSSSAETAKAERAPTMTRERFSEYIAQLNAGDPARDAFYTEDVVTHLDGPVYGRSALLAREQAMRERQSITFTPELIAVDEANQIIAAEMTIRHVALADGAKLGNRPQPASKDDALVRRMMLFYELKGDRIASIRPAKIGHVIRRVDIAAAQAEGPTPEQLAEPMPATVNDPLMSRAKFADYMKLFSRFDPRFVQYYDPGVVFDTAPSPVPLHGPQAIYDFYKPIRDKLDEHASASTVVIDNAHNVMVVELHNRMVAARGDVPLPSRMMHIGDERDGHSVKVYTLRNGRISYIRGSEQSETFEPAARAGGSG